MFQKHWIALSLLLLTLVCFGHACRCEFLTWDDPFYVTHNENVQNGLTGANIRWAFFGDTYGGRTPLTWLSLQLDASLFGPEAAWAFHLTNVLLHAVSVVLFFYLLDRMTGELWPSAVCAAIFAVHPLRVESVAWIAERRDVLSMLLLLVTVAAYHYYTERPGLGRYVLVVLSFSLGLAAKQMLVTLPFALLLLDYWPLHRLRLGQAAPAAAQTKPTVSWKFLILEKAPLLVITLAVSLMTFHQVQQAGGVSAGIPWSDRLAVSLAGYLGYLEKTIWPANLAAMYPYRVPHWSVALMAAATLLAITAALAYVGRSRPMLLVGWLWFVGTLFPVSGVIQSGSQAMADRYSYVPHLGLLITVVWGVGGLTVWQKLSGFIRTALVALVLAGLGMLTWVQVWHWQDSEKLFRHTLNVTQNNAFFHSGYANFLDKRNRLEDAEFHYARALQIQPDLHEYNLGYGSLMLRQEKLQDALAPLQIAASLQPRNATSHYLLGVALDKLGRQEEAKQHLWKSIECWESVPRDSFRTPPSRKTSPHVWLCEMALRDGQPNQTLAQIDQLLAIQPDLMEAYRLRGIALGRLGRWDEAETALQTAVNLPPHESMTRAYLAFAFARQGKKDLAAREYANLLARAGWVEFNNQFAMMRVTRSSLFDPLVAEELALQICEATQYQDPRWLNTLAAAQAAKKDFASAQQTIRNALALMRSDPALTQQLEDRLRLYNDNKPLPKE